MNVTVWPPPTLEESRATQATATAFARISRTPWPETRVCRLAAKQLLHATHTQPNVRTIRGVNNLHKRLGCTGAAWASLSAGDSATVGEGYKTRTFKSIASSRAIVRTLNNGSSEKRWPFVRQCTSGADRHLSVCVLRVATHLGLPR